VKAAMDAPGMAYGKAVFLKQSKGILPGDMHVDKDYYL
jgi:hypothetical protein